MKYFISSGIIIAFMLTGAFLPRFASAQLVSDTGQKVIDQIVLLIERLQGQRIDMVTEQDVDSVLGDSSSELIKTTLPPQILKVIPPELRVFPESQLSKINGSWNTGYTEQYVPGSDWDELDGYEQGTLDEELVFFAAIDHSEDPENSYELRMGRGSQLYSIQTDQGELIGAPSHVPRSGDFWVDRVIQNIFVDTSQHDTSTDETKYFIHQAGTYARDGLETSFYSPMLVDHWLEEEQALYTMVWPQQAHVPSDHQSRILVFQKTRDMGDGVIEVSNVFYNFGDDTIDRINVPWMSTRRSVFDKYIQSLPDGSYTAIEPDSWKDGTIDVSTTNGWMAFANGTSGSSRGLGIVFGNDGHFKEGGFQDRESFARIGPHMAQDVNIFTIIKFLDVPPGEAMLHRYYIVINTLDEIQRHANELSPLVEYGPIAFSGEDVHLFSICRKESKAGKILVGRACLDVEPDFYTYSLPVGNAKPLFLVHDDEQKEFVFTSDPYALTERPHDGRTRFVNFLGWSSEDAAKSSCQGLVDIEDVLSEGRFSDMAYHDDGEKLYGLASRECE